MWRRIESRYLFFLARDQKGVTAIEFAMVGPILIAMIFSIIELSFLILKMLLVENAVEIASKQIYTGKVPDRAAFEQLICDNLPLFSNCQDLVNVEAIEITTFEAVPSTNAECRDSGENTFEPLRSYSTGTASAIMFLRVCVTTPIFTPGLGLGAALPKQSDGSFAVVSSTVFVNEPF